MGRDAKAILYRGVLFPEGYEFPWWDDDGEPGIEDWWLEKVIGWDPRNDGCYAARKAALEKDPVPVIIEHTASWDFSQIAICCWTIVEYWSGPDEADEIEIPPVDPEQDARLVQFLEAYCQPISEYDEAPVFIPKTRLAAFYG